MFEEIVKKIEEYNKIIIHRHNNPDGDALGSQIGLKHLILSNFKGKTVYTVGDEAGRYAFMEDSVMDEIPDSEFEGALSIILDTSSPNLISDDRYTLSKETARIDHHIFIDKITDTEVTDTSFESCAGMVAYMAKETGWKLKLKSATALYTGMVTDSGRFRYDATTARTFEIASFLMSEPIDTTALYKNLYAEKFSSVLNHSKFVLKIKFTDKNVAYIYNTLKEVEESGLSTFNVSRGMVGCMADIEGVDIWVNFTECEEGVLAELRSSIYNINPVAVKYGGGGHKKASGATLKSKEECFSMLKDLDEIIDKGETC